ncbi:hypothetical protein A374_04004 [Fictibacillus macauensis ZFHKF-1]|uniref:Uncharacterized protein n=1 Tax=Fictibacillus macauensis ZFHKF-1 TaxID=1196324 RepID=I8UII5_9BACL|nr:hypothetical protein [Fictibacillus macauensis]EIT86705.1 hypothetical protein A374_04004 [Fictibacillus macauensis ZFHKF-1]
MRNIDEDDQDVLKKRAYKLEKIRIVLLCFVVMGMAFFGGPWVTGTTKFVGKKAVSALLVYLMLEGVVHHKVYEARNPKRNLYMVLIFSSLLLSVSSLD